MSDEEAASANADAPTAAPSTASPQAAPPDSQGETETPAERPAQRILIGSQREGTPAEELAPKPAPVEVGAAVTPAAAPIAPAKSYPPPNVRSRLSPEQQAELDQAMAGASMEELLTGAGDPAAATELAPETKVKARVASLRENDVFFDLGRPQQGVAPLAQFDPAPEVGAEVDLVVARFNAEQGLYELSRSTAAVDVGRWDEVREGQVIEVTITAANKGGLECQVAGIRGFIPMGQISMFRIENAEEFVGQRLAVVITEANRRRKNLVLSHRALMERERKEQREKVLAEIAPGQVREGIVRSLQDFGAFIDLGGVDGLIHVSQLSWDRVGHPSEVLQPGQKISVRVEKVNAETGKISLAYRELGDNPWKKAGETFPVGSKVKGAVSKIMQFGAFVKLLPGVEGLIHISELGHGRVQRVNDVLSEGQEVEAKVLTVDVDNQRIALSLKALLPPPEKPERKAPVGPPPPSPEELKRMEQRREKQKTLKGGISTPSGGEQFGLKW